MNKIENRSYDGSIHTTGFARLEQHCRSRYCPWDNLTKDETEDIPYPRDCFFYFDFLKKRMEVRHKQ